MQIRRLKAIAIFILLITTVSVFGQKKDGKAEKTGTPVLWEAVSIREQDLLEFPGGKAVQPDLSRVTFVSEEKGGHSLKFKVKDGKGQTWVAKIGDEAKSETAAVRLMTAIGYKTDINYLIPDLTIEGKGKFKDVRLEARPEDVKRLDTWSWKSNPFIGTKEFQGLKLMMCFLNNWDTKEANNVIFKTGGQLQYAISDLGVSFGKTGSNPLPIFWRIGRSRNNPVDYSRSKFITGTSNNHVSVHYNGKNRPIMDNFTVADARWLADLLIQLRETQIRDAFRAANYSQRDIDLLTATVKDRIEQLDHAGMGRGVAKRK